MRWTIGKAASVGRPLLFRFRLGVTAHHFKDALKLGEHFLQLLQPCQIGGRPRRAGKVASVN